LDREDDLIYVYVLKSEEQWRFYVGMSDDPEKRLSEHNAGMTKSTRFYTPWSIILKCRCESRAEARRLEKYLKSGSGKEYIKRYWQNNFENKLTI